MLKFLFTMISSLAIGIFGTLYTINWQEEKLVYELGEIAQFGDVTYQNIRVRNEGWNPATNVSIQLQAEHISANEIKAFPKFDLASDDRRVGGYERIRRNEVATLSFAFKGAPISPAMITIKSDRSIAAFIDPTEDAGNTDWRFIALSLIVIIVSFIGLISAIAIPAYQEYRRKAFEHAKQLAKQEVLTTLKEHQSEHK